MQCSSIMELNIALSLIVIFDLTSFFFVDFLFLDWIFFKELNRRFPHSLIGHFVFFLFVWFSFLLRSFQIFFFVCLMLISFFFFRFFLLNVIIIVIIMFCWCFIFRDASPLLWHAIISATCSSLARVVLPFGCRRCGHLAARSRSLQWKRIDQLGSPGSGLENVWLFFRSFSFFLSFFLSFCVDQRRLQTLVWSQFSVNFKLENNFRKGLLMDWPISGLCLERRLQTRPLESAGSGDGVSQAGGKGKNREVRGGKFSLPNVFWAANLSKKKKKKREREKIERGIFKQKWSNQVGADAGSNPHPHQP